MADWEYAGDGGAREETEASLVLPAFVQDPMGVLRRRWLWMLACLVVGIGTTTAIVLTLEPTYRAETTILVSSQQIPEAFVRTTVVEDSMAQINAIIGQVLSRQNLASLVEKYALYEEQREREPLAAVIQGMRSDIEIWPQESFNQTRAQGSSQVFVIRYESADRVLAADVANELAGFFTAANIEMRNRQAQLTTDFLRREMLRAERELREQEHRITEFLQQRGGLPGELAANLARLERLQAQRQSLATQIDAAESRLMLLNSQTDEPLDIGPTPRSLLSDLKAELEHELVILTEEHPNVIALQRRIARLEADVVEQESIPTGPSQRVLQIANEQRQLRNLRAQAARIEVSMEQLDEEVRLTPMRQEEFAALEQRATVLRENYLGFLRKVQEAELAQSLELAQHGARISVLDRATPPSRPRHPRWKLMSAGFVGAFAIAISLAVILELLDGVVVSQKQLEALTETPVLGSVPRIA